MNMKMPWIRAEYERDEHEESTFSGHYSQVPGVLIRVTWPFGSEADAERLLEEAVQDVKRQIQAARR